MKTLARISAYLLHPVFGFISTFFLLMCLKPYWFGMTHFSEGGVLLALVAVYTCLIPVLAIVLLKFAGMIKSLEMEERTERIIPLVICLIFYLWMYINTRQDASQPPAFMAFQLGSIIALSLAFVLNNWMKISLHSLVMGAILAFWIRIRLDSGAGTDLYFTFSKSGPGSLHLNHWISTWIFLTGWIASARLITGAHERHEVYGGLVVGIVAILLGFNFWD